MSRFALDSFLDKWRQRWPEWTLVESFIPADQRQRVLAWFALLQEFEDIMNIAGDPLPADAKLAWWQQELRDWSGRRSRHPLGRLLEPVAAPWAELALTLPALQQARMPVASLDAALPPLLPFAAAVAAVERELFGRDSDSDDARAIAVQWLHARSLAADGAGASAGYELTQWRARLLQAWPGKPAIARPHRLWSRLARLRLRRELAGRPTLAPPLLQLWHGWRAASGGR